MPTPLEPPPEGLYNSKEHLVERCKEHAKQAGYAMSILKTNTSKKSIIIACVCYGKPANKWKLTEETRQRPNRSSKKTGCQMNCVGKEQPDGKWSLTISKGEHNHQAVPLGTYAAHRKRDTMAKERIAQDLWAGCAVRQTQAQLQQQFPGILITKQDIFNERAQAKMKALQGRSTVEALFHELQAGGYHYTYEVFPEGHEKVGTLSHLLIIHPRSLAIYKDNCDVLILDCTYKTNRYNYPLLDLVGCTGMNTSFNLGVCFLHNEVQEHYEWALQKLKHICTLNGVGAPCVIVTDRDLALLRALETVFPLVPNLLCYWHINKNVLTKARVYMPKVIDGEKSTESHQIMKDSEACSAFMAAWYSLVESETEEILQERLKLLRTKHRAVAEYCEYEWLDLYKEKIVRAYTNEILHFGAVTTSRAEGCHAKIKRYLQTSRNDLFCFFRLMQTLWDSEHVEYENKVGQGLVSRAFNAGNPIYSTVVYKIHKYAIGRCQKLAAERKPNGQCKGIYAKTYGMPCKHTILERMASGIPLNITDFHPHWWVDRSAVSAIAPSHPREPIAIPQRRRRGGLRGRGRSGSGPRGTRREPSSFEVVDASQSQSQRSKSQPLSVLLQGREYSGPPSQQPSSSHQHENEQPPVSKASEATIKKTREELEEEIKQGSSALQLARRTINEANSYFQETPNTRQALPVIDGLNGTVGLNLGGDLVSEEDSVFGEDEQQVVGQVMPEVRQSPPGTTPDPQPIMSWEITAMVSPLSNVQPSISQSPNVPGSGPPGVGSESSMNAFSEARGEEELRLDSHHPIAWEEPEDAHEDIRIEAIELARFIKSKGRACSLLELEFGSPSTSRCQPVQRPTREAVSLGRQANQVSASKLQRVRQEPGPVCHCSKKCDGRCGCRKASRRCEPNCHSMGLWDSIADLGDAVCCGNVRITSGGKELWPKGWTRTEEFVGTGAVEEENDLNVDRLWEIHVLDQTPVARLIQEAGGIDAFLIQEGYGREFGLLKRAGTLTLKAQQNWENAKRERDRRAQNDEGKKGNERVVVD